MNISEFWLGIMLSVPIGIIVGLMTNKIQQRFDAFGKKRALRKTKNLESEYRQVVFYKENPEVFTQYLVQVAIKTTFIGSLIAIFASLLFIAGQLVDAVGLPFSLFRSLQAGAYIAGQLVSTVGALMIVNICRAALSLWLKVKDFDNYQQSVDSFLNAGVDAHSGGGPAQQRA